jgi:hypothetical protein
MRSILRAFFLLVISVPVWAAGLAGVSDREAAGGLKEALTQGAGRALADQYNKIAGQAAGYGLVKAEDARIEQYVTRKALDGLFVMIAEEERAIRQNPVAAAGSLAKKVFGALGR